MKRNIIILRIILIILLIITFFYIFNFSSQDSKESGNLSRTITVNVTKNIKKIQELDNHKKNEVLDVIEKVIRKLAHFSEYTFLGILLMSLMSTYNLKQKNKFLISIGIGFLYACSDEFHQLFVPGRTAKFTDVLIDTSGVCMGCLILFLIILIFKKVKYKIKPEIVEKSNY